MMYTRRDVGKIALAAVPLARALAAPKIDSKFYGVQIGAITYSFRTSKTIEQSAASHGSQATGGSATNQPQPTRTDTVR